MRLDSYSYSFQGQEHDDEVKGKGNSIAYRARFYDGRIGKFLSLDPKASSYPFMSPYCYAANNPILLIDENGEGPIIGWSVRSQKNEDGSIKIMVSLTVKRNIIVVNQSSMELTQAQGNEIARNIGSSYNGYIFTETFFENDAQDIGIMSEIHTLYNHLDGKDITLEVTVNQQTGTTSYVDDLSKVKDKHAVLVGIRDEVSDLDVGVNTVGLANSDNGDAVIVESSNISPRNMLQPGVDLKASKVSVHEIFHLDGADDLYETKNGVFVKDDNSLMGSARNNNTSLAEETIREIVKYYTSIAINAAGYLTGRKIYQTNENKERFTKLKDQSKIRHDASPNESNKQGLNDLD